ncbi:M4 family metallopeptidase [Polyangium aurulentum]|uniref:M4 family metallopeptidase n=1 Tax=Polyangium aurulentum TaxID=2567896 RepID=UPI00146BD44B|nr:M4 family metallopeptidase [Polyangium aurulentum]UQA54837.1 M4 family metallopeptidase [Polyangium aurulentum]
MRERRSLSIKAGVSLLCAAPLALLALQGCSSGGPVAFTDGSDDELDMAKELSFQELELRVLPEEIDARRDMAVRRVFVDELSMAHTHMQQRVGGVPVFGGEAIVHLNRDGSFFALTDSLVRALPRALDTTPAFDAAVAIDRVLGEYDCADCLTQEPTAELFVLPQEKGARLVYRVGLYREDGTAQTSMPVVFIDAKTGEKVWEYDNLQTATGTSLYNGNVTINTYLKSGTYYLEDLDRKIVTRDNRNTPSSLGALLGLAGSTYDVTDANDVWGESAQATQKAAVEAHYGSAKTYDYFKNVHGRNGIDGSGGPGGYTAHDGTTKLVVSRVHYSAKYNNAFWNGSMMTYGDGDGTTFTPLVTLDICGHEMTHGVTERTANLTYSNESGALNEAISDIMGASVERYARGDSANIWLIGEDAYTPGTAGDALRYMDDPHKAKDGGYTANDDPDHYSERYTGTSDNGGVHINSGIVNKMFYLLAVGGAHHLGGSMTGIGHDKAAAIVYKALTSYMTSSTNFAQARTAMLNAAAEIHGSASPEYAAVGQAWSLVGVN